jgi:molecular chaperone DnaK (HSP70)
VWTTFCSDFGGGTLDLSLLHVSDGFVDAMGSEKFAATAWAELNLMPQ